MAAASHPPAMEKHFTIPELAELWHVHRDTDSTKWKANKALKTLKALEAQRAKKQRVFTCGKRQYLGMDTTPTFLQKHWTPQELAVRWGRPIKLVRKQLLGTGGVLRFGRKRIGSLRVPDSVLRVIEEGSAEQQDCFTLAIAAVEELKAYRRPFSIEPEMYVYIVHSAGLIKIGCTSYLESRIRNLRNVSAVPVELLVAMKGGRDLEARLHLAFHSIRQHGEWFTFSPDIRLLIEEVKRRKLNV